MVIWIEISPEDKFGLDCGLAAENVNHPSGCRRNASVNLQELWMTKMPEITSTVVHFTFPLHELKWRWLICTIFVHRWHALKKKKPLIPPLFLNAKENKRNPQIRVNSHIACWPDSQLKWDVSFQSTASNWRSVHNSWAFSSPQKWHADNFRELASLRPDLTENLADITV